MFTTQHYKKIALLLGRNNASEDLIESFCVMFEEDNPKFDEDKFLDALVYARMNSR